MRASLDQILADPNIALTAPDTAGLKDIAEASFGSLTVGDPPVADVPVSTLPLPEIVIGPDDRIQITDTASYLGARMPRC